jgi:sugar/nucleoside kinase (ribokinase family)
MKDKLNAVVAGHICLDIIPSFDHLQPGQFEQLFKPGHLVTTGKAVFSTGGSVSNTGLALHLLGITTRLVAKVGDDAFAPVVRSLVNRFGPHLADDITSDPAVATAYTVIINPPGTDRIFLHCPGANDDFGADDVRYELLDQVSLFHFGYPPIMRRMHIDAGSQLVEVLRRAKLTGVTTSLDLTFPDPSSSGGKADWPAIFRRALPHVDVFVPSFEELLFTLRRYLYEELAQDYSPRGDTGGDVLKRATPELLTSLSDELLSMGVKVALIKLGERGLYLRTASGEALRNMGRAAPADPQAWANIELWAPCFEVHVAGTTGSGDATIAGFLAALLRDFDPIRAVNTAVAVGACNVEAADALGGLCSWEATQARMQTAWPRKPMTLTTPGWGCDPSTGVWLKPVHPVRLPTAIH